MSFLLTTSANTGLSTLSTSPTATTILLLFLTIGNCTNEAFGSPHARMGPCPTVAAAVAAAQNDA